jgi:hypothetical protein
MLVNIFTFFKYKSQVGLPGTARTVSEYTASGLTCDFCLKKYGKK